MLNENAPFEVVWIIITAVIGCLFIIKRIFFYYESKRLKKGDSVDSFIDIMGTVLLLVLLIIALFGPPDSPLTKMLMTAIIITVVLAFVKIISLLIF